MFDRSHNIAKRDAAAGQLAATAGVTMYRDRLVQMIPTPRGFNAQFVSEAGGAKAQGTDQSSAFFFNTYQWSLKVTRANLAWTRSNGIGTASVAPNATLCALKVLRRDGGGTFGDVIFGIYYAATLGATGPLAQANFGALTSYSNFGGSGGLDLVAPGGAGEQAGGVLADYIVSACSRYAF